MRRGLTPGLTPRMAIASGLLALIVGVVFAILLVAIDNLRDSTRLAIHSREELRAAGGLERLVIDLETGQRGFVITGQERFLEPWNAARAAFPAQSRSLLRSVDGTEHEGEARRMVRAGASYLRDYSVPLVIAARRNEPSARGVAATAEGKRRVDSIRAAVDRFSETVRGDIADAPGQRQRGRSASDRRGGGRPRRLGCPRPSLRGYLTRAIARPVRRTAAAAGLFAGGDLAVRMPETGPGEVGELERAFNTMAHSLEASRDALRRLAEEQAALRRVATLVAQTVSPSELFETVTREVGRLSGADLARMERYESDGTVTGVAGWSRSEDQELAVGRRFALEGVSIAAQVGQTSRPARIDSFADAAGPIAQEVHALGIRSSVGCPIVVEGGLWGVITASTKRETPFPPDTESQIAEFTELVATAIANAEAAPSLPRPARGSSPPPTMRAGVSCATSTTAPSRAWSTRSSR